MCFPTKPGQPVWQPALGNPIYQSPSSHTKQHDQSFLSQAAPLLSHYSLIPETSPGEEPSGTNRDNIVQFRLITQQSESTRTS